MAFKSVSHISLMSCTFDGVKHGVTWMRICMEMICRWVHSMHSKATVKRRCISGRRRTGDARTHNLPLTGICKGIFAQVLAYGFINLKTFVRTQNLAFVRTYTFRIKSTESFIHEAPGAMWSTFLNFFMVDGCTFLGFKISTTIHCLYKAWKSYSRTFSNITLIAFVWKSYT